MTSRRCRPAPRKVSGATGIHSRGAMSFDDRDIRPSMDVYTRDNVYLGTIRAVVPGSATPDGERVLETARQSSTISGERLGPMPTAPLGNSGPERQSARALYATEPDAARPLGRGAIEVGRWWGLVGRRTIPLDAVQAVSLERVVLKLTADELPRR